MCAGRSLVADGARLEMWNLHIFEKKKSGRLSAAICTSMMLALPVAAQSTDAAQTCKSESWEITLTSITETGQAVLRMDGVDVVLLAQIQQAFGDHALVAVSPEAGFVLNVVLRASGDEMIRVQPLGKESAEEAADCDDAFREAVTGGASQ